MQHVKNLSKTRKQLEKSLDENKQLSSLLEQASAGLEKSQRERKDEKDRLSAQSRKLQTEITKLKEALAKAGQDHAVGGKLTQTLFLLRQS